MPSKTKQNGTPRKKEREKERNSTRMGKEDQHRLERASVVFGVVGERAVVEKEADAELAGAGAALHSRGGQSGILTAQGREGQGRGTESTGKVVAVWLQGHAAVADPAAKGGH
jgi:hypothetical protein